MKRGMHEEGSHSHGIGCSVAASAQYLNEHKALANVCAGEQREQLWSGGNVRNAIEG